VKQKLMRENEAKLLWGFNWFWKINETI